MSGKIVVMGASHGGPAVLPTILRSLPQDYPLPILLVQHIGPGRSAEFAGWLGGKTHLPVREAADGEIAPTGAVLVAAADRHLVLCEGGRIVLRDESPVNGCRPSVDVLFQSGARVYREDCLAVLLAGLGEDGARGAGAVQDHGGRVIVLDEASSQVFGMNRVAIEMGHADFVGPPERLADEILRWAGLAVAGDGEG